MIFIPKALFTADFDEEEINSQVNDDSCDIDINDMTAKALTVEVKIVTAGDETLQCVVLPQ